MPMIDFKWLIMYACSLSVCTLYNSPFISNNKAASTVARQTWHFTLIQTWWLFQSMLPNFPYTALACSIFEAISLSSLAWSATVLPHYLKAVLMALCWWIQLWVERRHLETLKVNKDIMSFNIDFETKLLSSCSKSVHKSLDIIGCVRDQSAIICKEQNCFWVWCRLHWTSLLLSSFGCKRLLESH